MLRDQAWIWFARLFIPICCNTGCCQHHGCYSPDLPACWWTCEPVCMGSEFFSERAGPCWAIPLSSRRAAAACCSMFQELCEGSAGSSCSGQQTASMPSGLGHMPGGPLACSSARAAAEIVSTLLDVVTGQSQPCPTKPEHGVEMQPAGGRDPSDSQISMMMDGSGEGSAANIPNSVHHR